MILPRFYCNTYFVFCYQTIPPIPKNSRSPPLEHEFSSFAKEESLLTSNSGPDSPRNAGAGQVRDLEYVLQLCRVTAYCMAKSRRATLLTGFVIFKWYLIFKILLAWLLYYLIEFVSVTQHGGRGWNRANVPTDINPFITHQAHEKVYHTTRLYAP